MINFFKKRRIITVVLILFSLMLVFSNNIYATDSIIQGAEDFLKEGTEGIFDKYGVKKASDLVYNIFFAVGTVIVVIVGAVLGIQFIMGSVEERAKVQESLIPFVIGAVVIFGSVAIWRVMVKALSGLS